MSERVNHGRCRVCLKVHHWAPGDGRPECCGASRVFDEVYRCGPTDYRSMKRGPCDWWECPRCGFNPDDVDDAPYKIPRDHEEEEARHVQVPELYRLPPTHCGDLVHATGCVYRCAGCGSDDELGDGCESYS